MVPLDNSNYDSIGNQHYKCAKRHYNGAAEQFQCCSNINVLNGFIMVPLDNSNYDPIVKQHYKCANQHYNGAAE